MENARLLSELRESLQQQTATADVLKVISRSTFDLQIVLKALIESAARLCHADKGSFRLARGEFFHHAASYGYSAEQDQYMEAHPVPAEGHRGSIVGRVLDEGRVVQVEDTKADREFKLTNVPGFESIQTTLGVPLLREGRPIGVLVLMRSRVERFSEKQIELVITFADQAVIAIENARLLEELRRRQMELEARTKELQESLEYQTATSEVLGVISRSRFELQPVLDSVVETAARLCGAYHAMIYRLEDNVYCFAGGYGPYKPEYLEIERRERIPPGRGTLVGRTAVAKSVVQIEDALADPEYEKKDDARVGNVRSMLGVPLVRDDRVIGVVGLVRNRVAPFSRREVDLVMTFADQAVIAIENVRLLDELQTRQKELEGRTRELEIASQHKSQFVANMSHELRTPLAAMLGYAELMQEGIYEPLGEKSLAALTRIRSNGKHLLGLINTGCRLASAMNSVLRRCCSISSAMQSSSPTRVRSGSPPKLSMDTSRSASWTPALEFRNRSGRGFSSSSIRSMPRIRRRKAELVLASPLPSRSSKCTVAASGWSPYWGRARLSI
jgi:GAF domain-containing protein